MTLGAISRIEWPNRPGLRLRSSICGSLATPWSSTIGVSFTVEAKWIKSNAVAALKGHTSQPSFHDSKRYSKQLERRNALLEVSSLRRENGESCTRRLGVWLMVITC